MALPAGVEETAGGVYILEPQGPGQERGPRDTGEKATGTALTVSLWSIDKLCNMKCLHFDSSVLQLVLSVPSEFNIDQHCLCDPHRSILRGWRGVVERRAACVCYCSERNDRMVAHTLQSWRRATALRSLHTHLLTHLLERRTQALTLGTLTGWPGVLTSMKSSVIHFFFPINPPAKANPQCLSSYWVYRL